MRYLSHAFLAIPTIDGCVNFCHTISMLASDTQHKILEDFFRTGTRQTYIKADSIAPPNNLTEGVHFIESGLVKSYDITRYQDENLLIIRKAGEMLGLTYAITGDAKNVMNAALAPTVTWFVQREDFLDFLRNNPAAALPVLETVTQMYRVHSDRIMTLEYRTVRERLASFLQTSAARFGETNAQGQIIISLPLTQQDIASSISATRETTSRTLTQLQQKGLIKVESARITILSPADLTNIISD